MMLSEFILILSIATKYALSFQKKHILFEHSETKISKEIVLESDDKTFYYRNSPGRGKRRNYRVSR